MRVDLLVVGGGAMGLSTAWAAARRGASVTLVDPLPLVNEHNASNDESKVFRLAYGKDEEMARLAKEALGLWRALERDAGRRVLHPTGVLLFPSPFADESYETLARLGEPVEVLGEHEAASIAPAFRGAAGGVMDPQGGWLDPPALLAALEARAQAHGATIRRGERVVALSESSRGVEARLASGERIAARACVVAAGFHAPELLPRLAERIQVTRQVELFFRPPPGLRGFPVFAALDEGFYGFPEIRGAIKVADHRKGRVVRDFEAREGPAQAEVDEAREWLAGRVPEIADAPLLRWRACLYDNAPEDRFLLGRADGFDRVWQIAGMSGHGIKFAPALGERAAAEALAR